VALGGVDEERVAQIHVPGGAGGRTSLRCTDPVTRIHRIEGVPVRLWAVELGSCNYRSNEHGGVAVECKD
jgi:hypothetical protein